MDAELIDTLNQEGFDTSPGRCSFDTDIAIFMEDETPAMPDEEFLVFQDGMGTIVEFKPIRKLYSGSKHPPHFIDGPTPEYEPFFILIERTLLNYCNLGNNQPTDTAFRDLYRTLLKTPDGFSKKPLFYYLRAACQLYMSLTDISKFEYRGVIKRLVKSAKTFRMSSNSTNYLQTLRKTVVASEAQAYKREQVAE